MIWKKNHLCWYNLFYNHQLATLSIDIIIYIVIKLKAFASIDKSKQVKNSAKEGKNCRKQRNNGESSEKQGLLKLQVPIL